ncbi:MAG: hypothetical protein COA94_04125 [Rickettsiales bacterium]|nr:MAG: hypothetical protein COA94_04125 [Rickettsiales bacterium]
MRNPENNFFEKAVIFSVLVHIIVIGLFFFGLPSAFERLDNEKDIMTFEVLPMSAITNVKNERTIQKKAKIAKKSKQIKNSKTAAPPKPKKSAQKPKIKNKPKNIPAKKKKIKVVEKQKEMKQAPPKQKAAPERYKLKEDVIDSILKNLESESEGDSSKTPVKSFSARDKGSKYARGMEYDEDSPLSITENLLVKSQFEKHWRLPVGAINLQDVRVMMRIKVEKDGSITGIEIKDVVCPPNSEATCKLVTESAVRAVKQASPLENLLPERYNTWKEFDLNFDPSLMAQ